jgi:hypothetical protein
MRHLLLILSLFAFLTSDCSAPTPQVTTIVVTATSEINQEQTPPPPPPTKQTTTTISCSETSRHYGETITCRIDRAYCDYRPDIGGQPTFCNDAPYPNHDFTLLVWGSDWSDLDGRCLLVTGEVVRYRGKPEIIAESRSQVDYCP